MKKSEIVKDNRHFNDIIHNKKFYKNNHFVIYIMKKEEENPCFGIAVSKKLGNAVVRNKLKRQVRVLITENKFLFPNHHDYIIMVKEVCLNCSYEEMKKNFINLIKEKVAK